MDNKNKILVILSLSGVIIVSVSAFYIPSVGGTVPLGMNPQEFQKQQNEVMYASIPFKIMMGGAGLALSSLLCIYVRISIEEKRERRRQAKADFKLTRITVEPVKEEKPASNIVAKPYSIPAPLVLPPVRPPYKGNAAIHPLPILKIRRYNRAILR